MSTVVRVVTEDGQAQIVSYKEASDMANDVGLDLICVSETSNPPVYKILDQGKYLYEQKRKEREQRKKQKEAIIEQKEVKFQIKIADHDFQTKDKMIKRFLSENKQVKITIVVKGREFTHPDIPRALAKRVLESVKPFIANQPNMKSEGSNTIFMLDPIHQ